MQPVQPAQVPQPQFQPQPQVQLPQPGRPTAADIMRGGVSVAPAPAPANVPVPAPVFNQAPTPNFGGAGSRQPQQPMPMPLPGRDVVNQGISGGRPAATQPNVQVPQMPPASTNQPSAPVYSRPGYAAPTVAPSQNTDAPTGFRRGGYAPPLPRVYNDTQKPKAESKAEAKAEREAKPAEPKQQEFRAPIRGQ